MRLDNVVLSAICVAATALAGVIAWRGRALPVVADRLGGRGSGRDSVLDAARRVACVLAAATVAGTLVVGLGGRLVMRIAAATSGDGAQGRLTEADEIVGEITFGGTAAFIFFVGILLPVATSLLFVPLRHVFPKVAWLSGFCFGAVLLATAGVSDPISPDNIDFAILSPTWLAVVLVAATAALYGATFAALYARLDTTVPFITSRGGQPGARSRSKLTYVALVWLLIPFVLVPAVVYTAVRAASRGRVGAVVRRDPVPAVLLAVGGVMTGAAVLRVAATAAEIV